MSYNNSYGGGYNNRGNGGYRNNFNNNNNNQFFHNQPRINENQVPQSKHTIFIRGLHGDITTEDIKEYIGEKVGKISFDFVKVSQDRSKIFVAVRFEKRDEAKEFMELYSDREFMGCRCELKWFRDIRRYCAYQRAKQVRSNSQRRRRRSDSEDSKASSKRSPSPDRRRSRSRSATSRDRSRTRTRSPSRSQSRSPVRRERKSRARTRSATRSRSQSYSETRSRTRSRSSNHSRSVSSRRSKTSVDEERDKSKNKDQASKNKRRREQCSDGEDNVSQKMKVKEEVQLPQIPLPLPPKESPKAEPPTTPKEKVYIPPPTSCVDMEIESPPRHVSTNPYQRQSQFQHYQQDLHFQTQVKEPSPVAVSYSVPMEEEAPPKMIIREVAAPVAPVPPVVQQVTTTIQQQTQQVYQPPAPAPSTPQPAFVPRQVGKIEIVMPSTLPAPAVPAPVTPVTVSTTSSSNLNNGLDASMFPHSNKHFGHLRAFQSALLSTVKYEPPVKKEEEEDFSSLHLSSMATEEDPEEVKTVEREEKLARLTDEQMLRFCMKKKTIEAAYRKDCEAYTVVTKALLSKDESLLFGLKMSLLENMDDLYKTMMQRLDDQLNSILAMA